MREPMDRFPCAYLTSRFVSIGSNWMPHGQHEFDAVFDTALEKALDIQHDAAVMTRKIDCHVHESAVNAWLTKVVRPLGVHPRLGQVPVKIHGLRISPDCIQISDATQVVRIEFVVFRHGDDDGLHYMCLITNTVPYQMLAYRRLGHVDAGLLWSVSRAQPPLSWDEEAASRI